MIKEAKKIISCVSEEQLFTVIFKIMSIDEDKIPYHTPQ